MPNDIGFIVAGSRIKKIFTNGAAADRLYKKFIFPVTGIEAVRLSSTSPANAAKSLDSLIEEWSVINVNNG